MKYTRQPVETVKGIKHEVWSKYGAMQDQNGKKIQFDDPDECDKFIESIRNNKRKISVN